MSDTYTPDITVTQTAWLDLASIYTAAASVNSTVQNKGFSAVCIVYTANSTAPTSTNCGHLLQAGETWIGNAAHIWAIALNEAANVSIGIL